MSVRDLLDPNDPDWLKFQEQDPEWFLRVAGDTIREYCGWHIWPNIAVTDLRLPIGSKGIIMLPSRYVTDVVSVTAFPRSDDPQVLDPATDYVWDQAGWIERVGSPRWGDVAGYYYGPDPYYLPVWQAGFVGVSFNHGYEVVPTTIKQVAYELAMSTTLIRVGGIKSISTPGFRLQPGGGDSSGGSGGGAGGASTTASQRNRLARYRVGGVI